MNRSQNASKNQPIDSQPTPEVMDTILKNGLLAYRRTQQRLTDPQDRERLNTLIEQAGPEGLVLDARYGIRIRVWEDAPKGWGQSDLFEEEK